MKRRILHRAGRWALALSALSYFAPASAQERSSPTRVDVDVARDEIFPRIRDIMVRITGDDPSVNEEFRTLFVDWYLHRVWEEMAGPLNDAISPIPIH